jgi:hypothetical protein
MQALPDAFEMVHETAAPETRLWQVKPPAQ